ncbi:hypothetical protein Dda_0175 [Drechslerella dactyloides]|uniref:Uncharacterized protein n=1 Tax=Drechslerella dactyloides TaxID=74499 RepID=A0AAD6J4P0_DREDA|nr:hypothetical protein Dda_0175 [Drechslerella dactyloides]
MSVDSANDRDILKRAGPAFCWPFGRCKYQDALACAEYLGKIGDRDCEVRKEVVFCARNGCKWTGKVYKGDYTKSKW